MRMSVRITGHDDTATSLRDLERRLEAPPREPLAAIGDRWAERFRDLVRRGGPGDWAPRSLVSERLRPGRLMDVTGSLVESIQVRTAGDNAIVAGSEITPRLAALAFGSRQSSSSAFPGATTPGRPWAVLESDDIDQAVADIADYYLGEARA